MKGSKHTVTIEIDTNLLRSFTDEFLAAAWIIAQANPAPCDDLKAGRLADSIGDEIIRRWLKKTPAELYNHSERQAYHSELVRNCIYIPGAEDFHSGQWISRTTDTEATDV